jgi:membrane-bound lytic murein transglycosylase D
MECLNWKKPLQALVFVTMGAFFLNVPLYDSIATDLDQPGILLAKAKKKSKKTEDIEAGPFDHLSPHRDQSAFSGKFKVLPPLREAVDFWKMVYTKYDRNFEIFHDTENLGVIYSVMDFTDLYNRTELTREERLAILQPLLDAEEARIKAMLLRIHEFQRQPDNLNNEERRILEKFKGDNNPDKFLEAADEARIRAQTGIRNKFIEAIRYSGAYVEEFEDIFAGYGIPMELTRLAFVESMFNVYAQSKVGASGMWQFMPSTARVYGLVVNGFVDERNDPIAAAHAAARLLKSNYEALGTWPLAINAYNSGRATMSRAVQAMGTTKISKIIKFYRGGVYGFASRNFYPSFLAALEVSRRYKEYFGELPRDSKFVYDTYIVKNAVLIENLAATAGISLVELAALNPHYSEEVQSGLKKIPAGYAIRVPKGSTAQFAQAEAALSAPPSDLLTEK